MFRPNGSHDSHVLYILTLHEVVSVLVEHQEHVGDLSSDRWHVVRVEILLDGTGDRKVFIQQKSGSDSEKDVGTVDCLLDDLEGDDDGRSRRVDSGTDQDQTEQDTDKSIADNDGDISSDTELVGGDTFRDLVSGLFRLLPFDEYPSYSDGGVDGTDDRDDGENTGSQRSTTKTLSSFLKFLYLFLPDGFFIRHLDELLRRFGFWLG